MCSSQSSLPIFIEVFPLDFQGHNDALSQNIERRRPILFFSSYLHTAISRFPLVLSRFPLPQKSQGKQSGMAMAALVHNVFRDSGSLQPPFCHSWGRTLVHIVLGGSICIPGSKMEGRQREKRQTGNLLQKVLKNYHSIVSFHHIGQNVDTWPCFTASKSGIHSLYSEWPSARLKFLLLWRKGGWEGCKL